MNNYKSFNIYTVMLTLMVIGDLLNKNLFVSAPLHHVVLFWKQRAIFIALPNNDKMTNMDSWLMWLLCWLSFHDGFGTCYVWKVEEMRWIFLISNDPSNFNLFILFPVLKNFCSFGISDSFQIRHFFLLTSVTPF